MSRNVPKFWRRRIQDFGTFRVIRDISAHFGTWSIVDFGTSSFRPGKRQQSLRSLTKHPGSRGKSSASQSYDENSAGHGNGISVLGPGFSGHKNRLARTLSTQRRDFHPRTVSDVTPRCRRVFPRAQMFCKATRSLLTLS